MSLKVLRRKQKYGRFCTTLLRLSKKHFVENIDKSSPTSVLRIDTQNFMSKNVVSNPSLEKRMVSLTLETYPKSKKERINRVTTKKYEKSEKYQTQV